MKCWDEEKLSDCGQTRQKHIFKKMDNEGGDPRV